MRVHLLAGICALGVGWAGGPSDADGPAPAGAVPAGVTYSDVSARLAAQDAPLWLHLRIESDGRFALRSAMDAEAVTWTARGSWRFAGTAEDDAEALRGLEVGLASALATEPPRAEPPPDESLEPDGYSMARLLIDVDAEAPWRHVQWTVQSACAPEKKVWRLTFLVPGEDTTVDVDLPKDQFAPGSIVDWIAQRVCGVEVRLFRRDLGSAGRKPFTRLKVRVLEKTLVGPVVNDAPTRRLEPKVLTGGGRAADGEAEQMSHPAEYLSIDLPSGTGSSAERTAAFLRLTEHVLESKSELPLLGVIKTPPAWGGAVPSADVIEVLMRLREAGCETLQIEGAPPPDPRKASGAR